MIDKIEINLKSIIFDFDGVIVESNNIKTNAFEGLYKPFGNEIAKKVIEHHVTHGGISRFEKFKLYHKELLGIDLTTICSVIDIATQPGTGTNSNDVWGCDAITAIEKIMPIKITERKNVINSLFFISIKIAKFCFYLYYKYSYINICKYKHAHFRIELNLLWVDTSTISDVISILL